MLKLYFDTPSCFLPSDGRLECGVLRCAGEGDDVADVLHPSHEEDEALFTHAATDDLADRGEEDVGALHGGSGSHAAAVAGFVDSICQSECRQLLLSMCFIRGNRPMLAALF